MNTTDFNVRINRLVGQIEGIRRMVEGKREVSAILQQVLAARQALSRIGILLMKNAVSSAKPLTKEQVERLIRDVFRM